MYIIALLSNSVPLPFCQFTSLLFRTISKACLLPDFTEWNNRLWSSSPSNKNWCKIRKRTINDDNNNDMKTEQSKKKTPPCQTQQRLFAAHFVESAPRPRWGFASRSTPWPGWSSRPLRQPYILLQLTDMTWAGWYGTIRRADLPVFTKLFILQGFAVCCKCPKA